MWKEAFLFLGGCLLFPSAFHVAVYIQRLYFRQKLSDVAILAIATRVVSTIQAVMACVSGMIIVNHCKDDVLYDNHWLTSDYYCFGAPYFYYDAWAMYQTFKAKHPELSAKSFSQRFYQFVTSQPLMMFHHLILPIFFLPAIVYFRRGLGDFFVGCFYCIELAVPCLSLRGILLHLKKEDTMLYMVNGVVLIITYACCRILIFPFMYAAYGRQFNQSMIEVVRSIPIKCNVGCFAVFSLQLIWISQMFIILARTLHRKYAKRHMTDTDSSTAKLH